MLCMCMFSTNSARMFCLACMRAAALGGSQAVKGLKGQHLESLLQLDQQAVQTKEQEPDWPPRWNLNESFQCNRGHACVRPLPWIQVVVECATVERVTMPYPATICVLLEPDLTMGHWWNCSGWRLCWSSNPCPPSPPLPSPPA